MIFEQRPSFSSTGRIAMLGVISTWSLRQWFSTHKTAACTGCSYTCQYNIPNLLPNLSVSL